MKHFILALILSCAPALHLSATDCDAVNNGPRGQVDGSPSSGTACPDGQVRNEEGRCVAATEV